MRLFLIAVFCGCLAVPAFVNAKTPCDGVWNVKIETRAGSCDPSASYAVTVMDGKVSGPGNVSGTVGRSGNVRVSIGAAYANGNSMARRGQANGMVLPGRSLQRQMGGTKAMRRLIGFWRKPISEAHFAERASFWTRWQT